MKEMDNEAQLAAVLGHEIAHIVARHSVKKLQQIYGVSLLVQVALGEQSEAVQGLIGAAAVLLISELQAIFFIYEVNKRIFNKNI